MLCLEPSIFVLSCSKHVLNISAKRFCSVQHGPPVMQPQCSRAQPTVQCCSLPSASQRRFRKLKHVSIKADLAHQACPLVCSSSSAELALSTDSSFLGAAGRPWKRACKALEGAILDRPSRSWFVSGVAGRMAAFGAFVCSEYRRQKVGKHGSVLKHAIVRMRLKRVVGRFSQGPCFAAGLHRSQALPLKLHCTRGRA